MEASHAGARKNTEIASPELNEGIGPVKGSFRIFDRDKEVLALFPVRQLLREFLDENGGVRVYRDGVRVHDYGEHDDDWLGLDLRRVNKPTRNLSRNIVVGEIRIDLAHSKLLVEKTNREGFVANRAYANLRRIVLGALTVLEAERQKDKSKIRQRTGGGASKEDSGINRHLDQLRQKSRALGVLPSLKPSIDQIEKDYREMRDTFSRRFVAQECGEVAKDAPDVGKLLDRDMSASSLFQTVMRGADAALDLVLTCLPGGDTLFAMWSDSR